MFDFDGKDKTLIDINQANQVKHPPTDLAVSPNAAYKIKYLYVDPKRKDKNDYRGAQYSDVETLCSLINSSPDAIDAFLYSPQNEEEQKVKNNIIDVNITINKKFVPHLG